jgi:hypothetical protein
MVYRIQTPFFYLKKKKFIVEKIKLELFLMFSEEQLILDLIRFYKVKRIVKIPNFRSLPTSVFYGNEKSKFSNSVKLLIPFI